MNRWIAPILIVALSFHAAASVTSAAEDAKKSKEKPAPEAAAGKAGKKETEAKATEADTKEADKNVISFFDGKTLGKWKPINFGGEGEVRVEDGNLHMGQGALMTGIVWEGEVPARTNYEVSLEAKKIFGDDFFVALTAPVADSYCTYVCGGWGGGVVGISSIDDFDASENETATIEYFENERWYTIRMRVEPERIQCWIDDRQVVDLDLEDREISLRPGDIDLCVPLGLAAYQTEVAYRNIQWKNLPADAE